MEAVQRVRLSLKHPRPLSAPLLALAASLAAGCMGGASPEPPLPELNWAGDSAEARQQLAQALALAESQPRNAEAAGRLGMLSHAYYQYDSALQCYERAAALDPDAVRWVYYSGIAQAALGKFVEAAQSFRRAMELGLQDRAARLRLAEALLAGGETEQSRVAFEAIARDRPASAAAHYGLGRACAALGQTDRAIQAHEKAAALSPESGAVRYALAMSYRDAGQADKASVLLAGVRAGDRSLPGYDDPLMAEVQSLRRDHRWRLSEGLRLESDGRLEQAREQYALALRMKPDYGQAHVNLIAVYGRLKQFDEAEKHYRAALAIVPDSEELHTNWGAVEASRGHWNRAASSYERALEINPNAAAAHGDLGMIRLRQGRGPSAEAHFEAALRGDPTNRLARFHWGRRLVERGRVKEGIGHLEQSLEPVDDRTPTFLYGLADAHLRAGDVSRAMERGKQALELARRFDQRELAATISQGLRAVEGAK